MCGINGIIDFKRKQNLSTHIKKMNDAVKHRGPDNEGIHIHNNIALGHRRLSIIDLSEAAAQPITDNSGRYTLVYNGEIYNYKEIKQKLQGVEFKTDTDSEILLSAFIKWGIASLNMFEGMFAFAIYDKKKNETLLARDRMGIKPLYYYRSNEFFLFSSEIKSLLASEIVPRKINKNSVYDYIRYQTVHAPQTIIENVNMLNAGSYMIISNSKIETKSYWKLEHKNETNHKSYNEIKTDISDLLYAAVEKRMMSDVPLGAFLSGGIDSSIITGIMSKLKMQKVNTFSVNFNEAEYSEGKYARQIAKQFNTNHTEILLKPKDFLDNLPYALQFMDHPSGDGPNSYIVSKVTKEAGITVALSGLGGDEIFAGYKVFKQVPQAYNHKILSKIPQFARKLGASSLLAIKKDIRSKKMAELLQVQNFNFENIYSLSRLLYTEKEFQSFFSSKEISPNRVTEITSKIDIKPSRLLSAVSAAEIQTYLQNTLLRDTDQMSMASSLEVRVPFLDYQLVEYVYNVSDKFKYPHTQKKLLVDSLNILPDEIINRPKMGFLLPWELWLKNELFSFADKRIRNLASRPFFNENYLLSVWNDFLKGNSSVSWARLWIFIVLEDYIQRYDLEFN
ncbi:MAG: asparagine synthase (glutamine-hydrolyzing), partial [Bacteroidota bacterium]|nr:asparagine synthase (glutamine-hydrolyzing) [Bacteroidota bacterium]